MLTPININMCFGCSNEPSHGSFEYPQHIFVKKKMVFSYTLLSGGGLNKVNVFSMGYIIRELGPGL